MSGAISGAFAAVVGRGVGQRGRLMGADFVDSAFEVTEVADGGHVGYPTFDFSDIGAQLDQHRKKLTKCSLDVGCRGDLQSSCIRLSGWSDRCLGSGGV